MQRVREQPPQAPSSESVQERLRVLFNAGRTRARAAGRPVLVTTTERVSGMRALDILDPRGTNQMYWASPRDSFAIAGVGSAVTLSGKGDSRFGDVARAWQQLLDDAVFHDAAYTAAGGPVLMGGFSFDPDGPHSPTWSGFDAACFTIPRLTVACQAAGCWLTLNAIVSGDQDERALGELVMLRDKIRARVASASDDDEHSAIPTSGPEPDARSDARADVQGHRWRETVRDALRAIESGRREKVVLARAVRVPLAAGRRADSRRRRRESNNWLNG
jgi:isochorismate synthase EntC